MVHYDVSQQYREHYDFFDSDVPGYAERMGEQVWWLLPGTHQLVFKCALLKGYPVLSCENKLFLVQTI